MKVNVRWYDSIFVLLFTYLLVLQIQAIWPLTIDDMFISLRYAKHWAAGHGLLWNLDSPPVEGYSNFSFVALAALALHFNADPILTLKIAGWIGLVATCFFVFLISRFWFTNRLSLIPCIFLLLYKGQIIWAVSGFETTVYEALLCASVYCIFRGLGYCSFPEPLNKSQPRLLLYAGLLMSLAGMTRPEAPALMILFFILIAWSKPASAMKSGKNAVIFGLPILFLYCPYFLWRWHYYGFLFPNSVYCKGFITSSFALDLNYLKLIWPFVLLALPAWMNGHDKRYYFLSLPSVVYLLMLMHSDPIVAFDNRLFLPAFALLLPLALWGMSCALLRYLQKKDLLFVGSMWGLSLCIALIFIPRMTLAEYDYFSQKPRAGEQLRKTVLEWLGTHTVADDTVVIADSGLIPYYSDLKFIDSYCLNNVSTAHYPQVGRYEQFCQQILREEPKIIILTSLTKQGKITYTPGDSCLKKILSDDYNYNLSGYFSSSDASSTYRYELFTHF